VVLARTDWFHPVAFCTAMLAWSEFKVSSKCSRQLSRTGNIQACNPTPPSTVYHYSARKALRCLELGILSWIVTQGLGQPNSDICRPLVTCSAQAKLPSCRGRQNFWKSCPQSSSVTNAMLSWKERSSSQLVSSQHHRLKNVHAFLACQNLVI